MKLIIVEGKNRAPHSSLPSICQLRLHCQPSHNASLRQAALATGQLDILRLSLSLSRSRGDRKTSALTKLNLLLAASQGSLSEARQRRLGDGGMEGGMEGGTEGRSASGVGPSAGGNEPPPSTKTRPDCHQRGKRRQFVSRRLPFLLALFAEFPYPHPPPQPPHHSPPTAVPAAFARLGLQDVDIQRFRDDFLKEMNQKREQ